MKKLSFFVLSLGIFLLSFLYNLYFLPYGISLIGEGYYVYSAEQVMEGRVLFRDIASFGLAPGQFYSLGFFMRLFGFNLLSERLYYLLFISVLAVVVFLISNRIIKNTFFSLLPSLLFIFFIQHKTDRLLFPMLTLLLVILYDQTNPIFKSKKFPFLIGLMTGLSVIFSQELGAVLAFSLLIFFFWKISFEKKKGFTKIDSKDIFWNIALYIIGSLAVVLPVVLFFIVNNAFYQMIHYLIYFPFAVYAKAQRLLPPNLLSMLLLAFKNPSIRPLYNLSIAILFYFALSIYVLSALFFIMKLFKNYSRADSYILLLLLFGIFSSTNAFVHADTPVLLFGMVPAIILGPFLLDSLYSNLKSKSSSQKRFKKRLFFCIITISLLLLLVYGQLVINPTVYAEESNILILKNKDKYSPLNLERAKGIMVRSDLARDKDIGNVVNFIKNNTLPSDNIFVVPYESMFNFLTDRDNPTKYNQFVPGQRDKETELESIDLVEKAKTKFIIYGHGWDVNNISFASSYPLIYNYIKEKWVLNKTFGIYEIYSSQL